MRPEWRLIPDDVLRWIMLWLPFPELMAAVMSLPGLARASTLMAFRETYVRHHYVSIIRSFRKRIHRGHINGVSTWFDLIDVHCPGMLQLQLTSSCKLSKLLKLKCRDKWVTTLVELQLNDPYIVITERDMTNAILGPNSADLFPLLWPQYISTDAPHGKLGPLKRCIDQLIRHGRCDEMVGVIEHDPDQVLLKHAAGIAAYHRRVDVLRIVLPRLDRPFSAKYLIPAIMINDNDVLGLCIGKVHSSRTEEEIDAIVAANPTCAIELVDSLDKFNRKRAVKMILALPCDQFEERDALFTYLGDYAHISIRSAHKMLQSEIPLSCVVKRELRRIMNRKEYEKYRLYGKSKWYE